MEDDPSYDIAIARVGGPATMADDRLIEAVTAALRHHETPSARISIALVDDAQIATLNRQHLGHEGPTDVLSFDLRDATESASAIEGEVVISVETAQREATARGHGIDAEVALYAIHGTLHLLGYDDQTEEAASVMHRLEDELLASVGMPPAYGSLTQ